MIATDRFGNYSIIRKIGRGAMGVVYLAIDGETGREVAVKRVYHGPEPEDREILEAERLGAELQKRLTGFDKRVVRVTQYGEIEGDLFIEMEFIAGEDLSSVMARGPVQPGFAVHVGIELCSMLENLSSFMTVIGNQQFAGIVHGDLKPRNIRLNGQNEVKVLDFGIAKALSHTRKSTTNVFASTAYCSPERLESQSMDSHSDLWSVGVLLYQMIAGRLPFDEASKERLERRIRSARGPVELPDSCPEPLRRIIRKMLTSDLAHRYQTAREVHDDLVRFRSGEPVTAESTDTDATERTTEPSISMSDERTVRTSPIDAPPLPVEKPAKAARRRPWRMAIFGVVCLLIILFVSNQIGFWNEADKLNIELQTEKLANLDDAWTRYQALLGRFHVGILIWGAERALKQRLIGAADEPIHEFRNNDAPLVYKTHWVRASKHLQHAVELDPGDKSIKGRLRLCEAHIARIDSTSLKQPAKQKQLNIAENKFEESAALLKTSPDPYVGLARLYAYDVNDVERAREALKQAERFGHRQGRKEAALLGDAYRIRADLTWIKSRSLKDSPTQEKEYLERARQDYIQAQDLYQQSGLYGDSTRNQMKVIQGQKRIEDRLSQVRGWSWFR